MKGTILLNHTENTKQVEDEEKTRFLRSILEEMGLPVQEFWAGETSLSIDQRIKLRGILATYGVQVIDDLDGRMQIWVSPEKGEEPQKVAEWHKCIYKLKRDLRQLDPRKQLYLEMEINCWSLFEEEQQAQS
jgi:hypothetical protein